MPFPNISFIILKRRGGLSMFIRSQLKEQAKRSIHRNLWYTIGIGVIATLLLTGSNFIGITYDLSTTDPYLRIGLGNFDAFSLDFFTMKVSAAIASLVTLFGLLYSYFISNPIQVGYCKYYLENRVEPSKFEVLFDMFKKGCYFNVVKIMFLKDVYTILWTFLFFIPGIYKLYQYYMIPFILAENPYMDSSDVFEMTKLLTDHQKLNIFVLELSFILWYLLVPFTCGLVVLYLNPYTSATMAECYLFLKQKAIENGDLEVDDDSEEAEVEVEYVEPTIDDLH